MTVPATSGGPNDDRLREPPIERFAADEHAFDLRAEIEALKGEHPPTGPSSRGHRQKTLYKRAPHGPTIALFRFEQGGGLDSHKANGTVTIHVIDGAMRIRTTNTAGAAAADYTLTADQLLILAPSVEHSVHALADSIMLLHVHLHAPATQSM